ncbi:hypothetical protein D0C36_18730 [Mucilaginibacter conchicola]|uniref:Lipocalin-like domain-containing protein n=1 Tax=Mucilaginibacter conchicola TaxID=2303333 RepID=A0A372NPX9_9SPHI|nr:hypothetical protein [Mucilaginibacter conchicola]RFZ90982.1 hypothetical protein D0C36_18730 [Mucilaginibacter conchicola]
MKHLFLLVVLGLSLSACTKKASDTPDTPDNSGNQALSYPKLIAAKWQQTADTVQFYDNGKVTNTSGQGPSEFYYQFNTDGTGQQINVLGPTDLSYILNEKNIIITYPAANTNSQPVIMPGTIRVLNSTTLCLFFDDINATGTTKSTQVIWLKKVG